MLKKRNVQVIFSKIPETKEKARQKMLEVNCWLGKWCMVLWNIGPPSIGRGGCIVCMASILVEEELIFSGTGWLEWSGGH